MPTYAKLGILHGENSHIQIISLLHTDQKRKGKVTRFPKRVLPPPTLHSHLTFKYEDKWHFKREFIFDYNCLFLVSDFKHQVDLWLQFGIAITSHVYF